MSRARATEPVTDSTKEGLPAAGFGSIIVYVGADGFPRPAIVTRLAENGVLAEDGINAVVFGRDHDDSEAGLKCGLVRKGDHWVTG